MSECVCLCVCVLSAAFQYIKLVNLSGIEFYQTVQSRMHLCMSTSALSGKAKSVFSVSTDCQVKKYASVSVTEVVQYSSILTASPVNMLKQCACLLSIVHLVKQA